MNESNEQTVTTNPTPASQPSPETQPQPAKKAWSQPTMTLLEISATANSTGSGSDANESTVLIS